MSHRSFALAILGSALCNAAVVLAHGPDAANPLPEGSLSVTEQKADDAFVPAHLLAAVCGKSGAQGGPAFERRLQLARLSESARSYARESPPLLENLGERSFEVTTTSEEAQRYFDQGLSLTYAFNHPEALRAFRHARRLDPGCAMCSWGEAYVLGPNINAPMDPDAAAPAGRAVARAQEAAKDVEPKESALITALAARYSADPDADRGKLNLAYAGAMAEVATRFPDDPSVQALFADALMNLAPWDYWEADGKTLKKPVKELVRVLEGALAIDPEHPYAIHLYIHAVEASNSPDAANATPIVSPLRCLEPGISCTCPLTSISASDASETPLTPTVKR